MYNLPLLAVFIIFVLFCHQVVHLIHLVFRPTRELNSRPMTMAQTVGPRRSPLDQGASPILQQALLYSFVRATALWSISCKQILIFFSPLKPKKDPMNCLSIDFHLEKVPSYNKYLHVNCTVCFTDLDQASEILSYISFPKSMKHTVGEINNCYL